MIQSISNKLGPNAIYSKTSKRPDKRGYYTSTQSVGTNKYSSPSFKGIKLSSNFLKKSINEMPIVKKMLIAADSTLVHVCGDSGVAIDIPIAEVVKVPKILDAANFVLPDIPDLAHTTVGKTATHVATEVAGGLHGHLTEEAVHGTAGHGIKGVVSHIAETIHDFLT